MRQGRKLVNLLDLFLPSIKTSIIALVVILSFLTLNHLKLSALFPIKHVRVYGVNRVDHKEVQAMLFPYLTRGFFSVPVEGMRDRLLQLPWISEVSVRRNWPDEVKIWVLEKEPVAIWNQASLLSTAGDIFTPRLETYPPHLPNLEGPDGKQIEMLDYFNSMNRILLPIRANISYLALTPYNTWKIKLSSGVVLQIGHKDILTRLEHFVKVYPQIVGDRASDVEYIDLRYSNGVAVRWKKSA